MAKYPVLWSEKRGGIDKTILGMYRPQGLKPSVVRYEDDMDVNAFSRRDLGGISAIHMPGPPPPTPARWTSPSTSPRRSRPRCAL